MPAFPSAWEDCEAGQIYLFISAPRGMSRQPIELRRG